MTQQSYKAGDTASAIKPLRTLAELGDEGTGRLAATDLTPRSPFPVHPGWYERYWYGDRQPSRWGLLASSAGRLGYEVTRVGAAARRAAVRTKRDLVQRWRVA
jgi:hypothetical protein